VAKLPDPSQYMKALPAVTWMGSADARPAIAKHRKPNSPSRRSNLNIVILRRRVCKRNAVCGFSTLPGHIG
jgi:hypothetical protein